VTYHTSTQGTPGATRQLDFVFASEELQNAVHTRALNDPMEWSSSDHCRAVIDVDA